MQITKNSEIIEGLIDQAALILRILGDPARFRIVGMLMGGELCACKFHEPLGLSQSLASHHLQVLQEAGIISGRKVGRNIFYSVNESQIEKARDILGAFTVKEGTNDNKSTGSGVC